MSARNIAVFYHCLFHNEKGVLLPSALRIIQEQVGWMDQSGLTAAASEIHCGINGGPESEGLAEFTLPAKSTKTFHGLQCRNEIRTMLLMEQWIATHPGWHVLYFHSKGATQPLGDERSWKWRYCMMNNLVGEWEKCVRYLDSRYDSVGCHWLSPPFTPGNQHIWAGNFFWAKSDFLRTIPSIRDRDRIRLSGLDALESRFEAEVWIGNGPRLPRVMDFHTNGHGSCF